MLYLDASHCKLGDATALFTSPITATTGKQQKNFTFIINTNSVLNIDLLIEDVKQYPDSYQYERAERLNVSQRCIGYNLKKLGITYKQTLHHARVDEEKRLLFQKKIADYKEASVQSNISSSIIYRTLMHKVCDLYTYNVIIRP